MYIPKVAATAQLAETRGTHAQKQTLAYAKTFAVCQELHDSFKKGETVTLEKLKEIIAPHAKGVDYQVDEFKKTLLDKNTDAYISLKRAKNTITGFSINLQTQNAKLNNSHLEPIAHELFHFFSRITTPKIAARENIKQIDQKQSHKETIAYVATMVTNFALSRYTGYYGAIATPFVSSIVSQVLCPTKIFKFYKKSLYEFTDKKTDISKLKKITQAILKKSRLKDSEKIDILQYWRYGLKDEQNAYTLSQEIDTKLNHPSASDPAMEGIVKTLIKRSVNNNFSFDEKIAMVEDIIKDEISTHRQKRRQKPAFSIKNVFQKLIGKD